MAETVERYVAFKLPEALACLRLFLVRHLLAVGEVEVRHGDVGPDELHFQSQTAMAVCEFLFE